MSSNTALGEMYWIQHYVIKFVSDLRQVAGFLRVFWFTPPRYNWNIVESGVKHHNLAQYLPSCDNEKFGKSEVTSYFCSNHKISSKYPQSDIRYRRYTISTKLEIKTSNDNNTNWHAGELCRNSVHLIYIALQHTYMSKSLQQTDSL